MDVAIKPFAMKNKGLKLITFALLLGIFANYSTAAEGDLPAADPVAELRNHDEAFSLLIECFRQMQTALVEADYESRLDAAQRLTDAKTHADVLILAQQERDLRLEKLAAQLHHMRSAYDYARLGDEREAGVKVASNVDTTAAAAKLNDYVAIVPVVSEKDEIVVTRIIPANLILSGRKSRTTDLAAR
jgi:hypothetical protein